MQLLLRLGMVLPAGCDRTDFIVFIVVVLRTS